MDEKHIIYASIQTIYVITAIISLLNMHIKMYVQYVLLRKILKD